MKHKEKKIIAYTILFVIIIALAYFLKEHIFWISTALALFFPIKDYLDSSEKTKNSVIKYLRKIPPSFLLILAITIIVINSAEYILKNNEDRQQSELLNTLNYSKQEQSKLIESLNYSSQSAIEHLKPVYSEHIEKQLPEIIIQVNAGECDKIEGYANDIYVSSDLKKKIRQYHSFCNFKKGNVDGAINELKIERDNNLDDFITNVHLYYYNIVKINQLLNFTYPYLRDYNREMISESEVRDIDYILDENTIYMNTLIKNIGTNNNNLDIAIFNIEDKTVNVRQLLMNLHNIQLMPSKNDVDFLDFIKKISMDNKVQFHISLCKYSFTEKEICKFNPNDIGLSCSNESYIINEDACWKALDIINTSTDSVIFDDRYKEYQINDILEDLAYHHFTKCTGYNYRELSWKKYELSDFNIKNESECTRAINILNSNDEMHYIRDNILEILYEHHFNKCTNSSLFDIRMKIHNGESFYMPNTGECKLSLHYVNELVNKSQWAWSYQYDKDLITYLVEYVEAKNK